MSKKIKEYLKINIDYLKLNKKFALVLTLNTLFVLFAIGGVKLIELLSRGLIKEVEKIDLSNILSESKASAALAITEKFFLFIVITSIAFVLFMIIVWSFFQSIIWSKLSQKKFTLKFFMKFLLLNVIWFLPWLALVFVILFGTKPNVLFILFTLAILSFFHFSCILYALFTKENKLKGIMCALKLGTCKLNYFVIPYIFFLISFIITTIILNLLVIYANLNLNMPFISELRLANLLNSLIILIFFSWLECCISRIVTNKTKYGKIHEL